MILDYQILLKSPPYLYWLDLPLAQTHFTEKKQIQTKRRISDKKNMIENR